MTEELLATIVDCRKRGIPAALTTIIQTKGSTPCKAGSKMLVFADGRTLGTIGGGCSEAEVKLKAIDAIHNQTAFVHTVSLLNDQAEQLGMVCGGVMDVFIQAL